MQLLHKLLINLALGVSLLVLLHALFTGENNGRQVTELRFDTGSRLHVSAVQLDESMNKTTSSSLHISVDDSSTVHLWCIMVKADIHTNLRTKFKTFVESLAKFSSPFTLHIISDARGQQFAEDTFNDIHKHLDYLFKRNYYDVTAFIEKLKPIVSAMQPHFSSSPGSYYSDSLFFMSLGLHRIAPYWIKKCIMVDIDTQFRSDPLMLWKHFEKFTNSQLFGLSPELSPVYRHTLYIYRSKHPDTRVGEPYSEGGYSGFNSGVILLHLERIRKSKLFADICESENVTNLAKKYNFHGHLGDQDFFTLLGIEYPQLFFGLPCTWNFQLCAWWRDHGYAEIFDKYAKCEGMIDLYHGNCNTQIPAF